MSRLLRHQERFYHDAIAAIDGGGDGLREMWARGAVRSGKTAMCGFALARLMLSRPGRDYLLAGYSRGSVWTNQAPYLGAVAAALGVPYRPRRTGDRPGIEFGDAFAHVRGLATEGSHQSIMGATMGGGWYDELARLNRAAVDETISRMSLPGSVVFVTLNPAAPMHWAKQYLDEAGTRRAKEYHSTIYDNDRLPQEYVEYLEGVYKGRPHLYARYILGQWAAAEGLVYQMVPDAEPQEADSGARLWIGADAGAASATAAVYLAERPGRRWVAVDEYYHDARTSYEGQIGDEVHAQRIIARVGRRPIAALEVDPAASALRAALSRFHPAAAAAHDVEEGIQRLDGAFRDGRIAILRGACPMLRAQLASYEWDEKAGLEGEDKPVKEDDHLPDALRYIAWRIAAPMQPRRNAYV